MEFLKANLMIPLYEQPEAKITEFFELYRDYYALYDLSDEVVQSALEISKAEEDAVLIISHHDTEVRFIMTDLNEAERSHAPLTSLDEALVSIIVASRMKGMIDKKFAERRAEAEKDSAEPEADEPLPANVCEFHRKNPKGKKPYISQPLRQDQPSFMSVDDAAQEYQEVWFNLAKAARAVGIEMEGKTRIEVIKELMARLMKKGTVH